MNKRLCDDFGIRPERGSRITGLVRWFLSNPSYDCLFGEMNAERSDAFYLELKYMAQTLRDLPGDTIETKWNVLMDKRDVQARTDEPVYLLPWSTVEDKQAYGPRALTDHWDDA